MAPVRLWMLPLLFFFATKVSGEFILAKIGESVNFTLGARCASGDVKLVTRDSSRVVAELLLGVWTPGGHYGHRIRHLSASQVELLGVDYNDEGAFEFMCSGSPVSVHQLDTVRMIELEATEGGPLRLPCDSSTTEPVRWEKDGALVVELNPTSGVKWTRTPRLNVSEAAWRAKGDASARLERVVPEDRGDYVCSGYDHKGKRRHVGLRVTVRESKVGTCPPPPSPPPTQAETWPAVASVFIISTVILVVIGVVRVCREKRCRGNAPSGAADGGADGGRAPQETDTLTGGPTSNGACVSFKPCDESVVTV